MTELRYDDRVAVVTGGGRGLGRAYAELLASRGAKVVINDNGASIVGDEVTENPADELVRIIKDAGGEAVACIESVATKDGGQAIIDAAMDTWGRVDTIVNNAGFLRDRMFVSASEQEWDAVMRVHLKGHFALQKFAALYFRGRAKEQGGTTFGRIIGTASESALFMEPGQPNYGPAKAGIINLTVDTPAPVEYYNQYLLA